MSTGFLQVEDISIQFGGIRAVDGLSFRVDEHEIVSLIGPNGAGKTTVFNILTGAYRTQSGRILFDGAEIQADGPEAIVRRGIARTFQNIRLFPDMKIIENILVGTHVHTRYNLLDSTFRTGRYWRDENENVARALSIMDRLGLLDKKDAYAGSLPYGDQRKVEIARALATGARLLLLDEPAAGMNPGESEMLMGMIKGLVEDGITVLLIEHDMSVVMNISDRVYMLENGALIAQGTPEEVAHDPAAVAAYLGGEHRA